MNESDKKVSLAQQEIAPFEFSPSKKDGDGSLARENFPEQEDRPKIREKTNYEDLSDESRILTPPAARLNPAEGDEKPRDRRFAESGRIYRILKKLGRILFNNDFLHLSGTRKVAYIAVLAALTFATKVFSLTFGSARVSFFYLPVFVSGALFGPAAGLMIGFIGDITGTFYQGWAFSPVTSLGNSLMGAIVGLIFFLRLNPALKMIIGAFIVLLLCSLGINTASMALQYGTTWTNALIYLNFPLSRIIIQPISVAANTILAIPIYYAAKRFIRR